MGFYGLSSYIESDNAADFYITLQTSIEHSIKTEIKRKANEYNTPGFVNVLLVIMENNFSIVHFLSPEFVNKLSKLFNSILEENKDINRELYDHIIRFNSSSIVMEKIQELE